MEIFDYSVTASNNNATPPNGFPENMAYSDVNDSARELMAVIARFYRSSLSCVNTTAGTSTQYTLASGQTFSAYAEGQVFSFKAHIACGATPKLNVNSKGDVYLTDMRGTNLGASDLVTNGTYVVVYRGSVFRVMGLLAKATIQTWADEVCATVTELNAAITASENVTRANLYAPSATVLVNAGIAPTGWTISSTHNNKALRLVNTSAGGTGGSTAFTSVFTSRTIAASNLPVSSPWSIVDPGHWHGTYNVNLQSVVPLNGSFGASSWRGVSDTTQGNTQNNYAGVYLGSNSGGGQAMDFNISYVDVNCIVKS